jgi:DNA polymerase-3 subunit gamma/tau
MSYQVIARKYRPQKFSDVVGQEHVTQTLRNAIEQNRIAHAYLFVGPRGTGKTTIARIFAKALNCTGGPKADFLEDDARCIEITEGRSLDVLEIDGASNRGIEEIRALRDTVRYAPASGKFKIYIIDEVHMLTKEAFNALLKTLEEPPEHVKFMFATTEPEKVLPTILSRCQRFDLRRIPSTLIVKHLGEIAAKEGVEIDDAALHAIARGAEGGMRDAESTLDQLISFCGNKIVEADVLSMFGLAARQQILTMVTAILRGEVEVVLRELNDLAQNGKDLGRLLTDLLGHVRNLLIYQVAGGDRSFLEASEAELAAIEEQAKLSSADGLTRIMEVLSDGEGRLKDASSKKILIEITLLKAIQARQAVSIDSLLVRLKDLQGQGQGNAGGSGVSGPSGSISANSGATVAKAASPPVRSTPMAESRPSPQPSPRGEGEGVVAQAASLPAVINEMEPKTAGVVEGDELVKLWHDVIEAASRASSFARAYLIKTHPISFAKGTFALGLDPEFQDEFSMLDTPKNRTLVQTKLAEMGFHSVTVRFVLLEAPVGWARPAEVVVEEKTRVESPAPRSSAPLATAKSAEPPRPAPTQLSKEDFKNDPLIKRALEIFKGQIVEVRA